MYFYINVYKNRLCMHWCHFWLYFSIINYFDNFRRRRLKLGSFETKDMGTLQNTIVFKFPILFKNNFYKKIDIIQSNFIFNRHCTYRKWSEISAYLQNKIFCSWISACAHSRTKFIFTDKIGLKIGIFCQINYFKDILYVKFNFESIGDNFEATGLLFLEILAENQQILMKTAFIFENKNPTASKLSSIDRVQKQKTEK